MTEYPTTKELHAALEFCTKQLRFSQYVQPLVGSKGVQENYQVTEPGRDPDAESDSSVPVVFRKRECLLQPPEPDADETTEAESESPGETSTVAWVHGLDQVRVSCRDPNGRVVAVSVNPGEYKISFVRDLFHIPPTASVHLLNSHRTGNLRSGSSVLLDEGTEFRTDAELPLQHEEYEGQMDSEGNWHFTDVDMVEGYLHVTPDDNHDLMPARLWLNLKSNAGEMDIQLDRRRALALAERLQHWANNGYIGKV